MRWARDLGLQRLTIGVTFLMLILFGIFGLVMLRDAQALGALIEADSALAAKRQGLSESDQTLQRRNLDLLKTYGELSAAYQQSLEQLEGKGFGLLERVMRYAADERRIGSELTDEVLAGEVSATVSAEVETERRRLQEDLAGDALRIALLKFQSERLIDRALAAHALKESANAALLDQIMDLAGKTDATDAKLARLDKKLASARRNLRKGYLRYDLSDHRVASRLDRYRELQTERIAVVMDAVREPAARYAAAVKQSTQAVNQRAAEVAATSVDIQHTLDQNNHLSLALKQQQDTAAKEREQLLQGVTLRASIGMLMVLVAVLLVGLGVRQLMVVRILALHRAMASIASRGELDQRLDVDGRDELGRIAADFDRFVAHIATMVEELEQGIEQLVVNGEQVAADVAVSEDAAQRLQGAVEQIAGASEELQQRGEQVVGEAEQAEQHARTVSSRVAAELPVVDESAHTNQRMAATARDCAEQVQSLSAETEQIKGVLAMIEAVAEQTNLLALNAAIEAARAGEHGRGFAVVADEVRALAQKTQQSTESIEANIKRLVNTTGNVTEAMGGLASLAGETEKQALSVQQALGGIAAAINDIARCNGEITAIAREQLQQTASINSGLHGIESEVERTRAGARNSRRVAANLAALGERLQQLGACFSRRSDRA
ncbi:methyl-accepting chemotaxis protein [Motiliproteus sediminis]|uniref:methyl-accepting chemotaxis protein n=1 Tax=Motiliproteus sediminis TaxID=1468178 RepID=UPI001AEF3C37|nr:methyl-accepting chemotaxis protein [Motiliproteus sediminis]